MKPRETPPPMPDAIVDEVRAIRAELSARFGNDVGKLCKYLRGREAQYGDRVVQPGKLTGGRPRRVASGRRR
jgi:hypothetical protein